MTDNDIIKALECIASEKDVLCKNCAYNKYYLTKCHKMTAKDALDLINRQKAEIERLKAESDTIAEDYSNLVIEKDELFDEAEKLIKKAKAEAVKEFADSAIERVEKVKLKYQRLCEEQGEEMEEHMHIHFNGIIGIINNLLKETVGE